MKITVVGDIGVDYYENINLLKPGGIAFNFAYNLSKSNIKDITLIGAIGTDTYSNKIIKLYKDIGLNFSFLQKLHGRTPKQNITLINGEREFTGYDAGILKKWKLRLKDLKCINNSDAVFVPLSDGMEHIFNAVKKLSNVIKVVDFSQDYEFADFDKDDNLITKNSKYFDIIFVGGKKKHEPMIKDLAKKFPDKIFILTLGAKGSLAFYNNKKYFEPAKLVTSVNDTTGCGDAFQAGFLASWLKTKDIHKSLIKGTNRASDTIKQIGSTPLNIK